MTNEDGRELPGTGARRARLEQRRAQRSARYGRFLWLSAIGSLIPGVGLIAAGKRRLGGIALAAFVLGVVGLIVGIALIPGQRLRAILINEAIPIGIGLGMLAAIWLAVALLSHRALEPRRLSIGRRLTGALVVTVAASLVVAPLAVGARNLVTARQLISAITLPGLGGGMSKTTPDIDADDPWADKPRVNILLLGGDGAEDRTGIRPDTQMVASIDTENGDTTLFQIPRNMQHVPFEAGSPLDEIYPDGFGGPGDPGEYLVNAVYQNVPALHPEIFDGVDNPGADANKWAAEGALGIDIDYYVLVNLDGFRTIVDALGGVTIDVNNDIPIGGRSVNGVGCVGTKGVIEAGPDQRLNGYHALWYARSRCASDDYDRMERQRCLMGAIISEADPTTLALRFQSLASATQDIVRTDIPQDIFPDFVELALRVKDGTITSLPFTNDVIDPANPDYEQIHQIVDDALTPAPEPEAGSGSDSGSDGDTDGDTGQDATDAPDPDADPSAEPGDDPEAGSDDTGGDASQPATIDDVC